MKLYSACVSELIVRSKALRVRASVPALTRGDKRPSRNKGLTLLGDIEALASVRIFVRAAEDLAESRIVGLLDAVKCE